MHKAIVVLSMSISASSVSPSPLGAQATATQSPATQSPAAGPINFKDMTLSDYSVTILAFGDSLTQGLVVKNCVLASLYKRATEAAAEQRSRRNLGGE